MTRCEDFAEALTLHASGDLDADSRRPLEQHLAACGDCARDLTALRDLVGALEPAALYPGETRVDWDRFARETVARVRRQDRGTGVVVPFRGRLAALLRPAMLARAAAAVLAVGLGFLFLRQPTPPPAQPGGDAGRPDLPAGVEESAVLPADFQARLEYNLARKDTREYLEQSRAVLINVLESPMRCSRDEIDISAARTKSLQLLRRQQMLRDSLSRPELARASELSNQLESVLTEISSLTNCADLERIQELRDAVRRNRLLVKIGVMQDELGGARA